jgi:hypothetical protein
MKFFLIILISFSFTSSAFSKGPRLKAISRGDTIIICNINCSKNCGDSKKMLYCDTLAILNNKWSETVENKVVLNRKEYSFVRKLFNSDTTYMSEYKIGKTVYANGELASIYIPQLVLVIKGTKYIEQYVFDVKAQKYRYYKFNQNGKWQKSMVINYYWVENKFNEILQRNGLKCLDR